MLGDTVTLNCFPMAAAQLIAVAGNQVAQVSDCKVLLCVRRKAATTLRGACSPVWWPTALLSPLVHCCDCQHGVSSITQVALKLLRCTGSSTWSLIYLPFRSRSKHVANPNNGFVRQSIKTSGRQMSQWISLRTCSGGLVVLNARWNHSLQVACS